MPARVNKIRHDENTRNKIQAGNLITRLQKFIMGEVEMSAPQVTAALGLLKKVLPDTTSVELSGDVSHSYVVQSELPHKKAEEWANKHVPTQLQ